MVVLLAALAGCRGTAAEVTASTTTSTTIAPTTTTTVAPTTTTTTTTIAPTTTTTSTTVPPTTTTTVPPTTTTTVAPTPVVVPVAALEAPLNPVSRGRAGDDTLALQNRLLELGYWLDGADSRYGEVTFQAVMAFQKQNGLKPTGTADQATVDAMSAATERVSGAAVRDEIEIDVTKQVLYIVRGGLTLWALNTSTGSGKPYVEDDQKHPGEQVTGDARTHIGEFKVSREQAEGWWQSPLGLLYRPKYFDGGIAVHGARNVPNYPASHGCVRVSMAAMDFIWAQNLMPKGLKVWVHA